MWYLIKQSLIPFAYLLCGLVIAGGAFSISDNAIIQIAILTVNLGLFLFVVFTLCKKEGENGYMALVNNDINRKRIVETGEDLPLKVAEEYTAWKGFAIGGIICFPLVIMIIIHTILIFAVDPTQTLAGVGASILYMVVFAFTRVGVVMPEDITQMAIDPYMYYWTLIAIPIILLATGIPYILGAKKVERQQQQIKETHRAIHGEKN